MGQGVRVAGPGRNQVDLGPPPQTLHSRNRSSTSPSQVQSFKYSGGGLLSCTFALLTLRRGYVPTPQMKNGLRREKSHPKACGPISWHPQLQCVHNTFLHNFLWGRLLRDCSTNAGCSSHPSSGKAEQRPGLAGCRDAAPSPSQAPSPHTSFSLTASAPQAPCSLLPPTYLEASDLLGPYPGDTCLGDIFPRWLGSTCLTPGRLQSTGVPRFQGCSLPGAPSAYQPRS